MEEVQVAEAGNYSRCTSSATEYHSTCSDLEDHALAADDHSTLSSSSSNLGSTLERTTDISSHDTSIELGLVNTEAQVRPLIELPAHAITLSHKMVYVMLTIAVFNSIIAIAMVLVVQLVPQPQPQARFALIPLVLSIVALICTTGDLIYRGRAEGVTWRSYWFFHPPPTDDRPFGSLFDAVCLICSGVELVLASIAYYSSIKHDRNPIRGALQSVFLAFGQLGYTCSMVWKMTHNNAKRINSAE